MTVILMLAMFAIFLTIDYLRHRKEVPRTAEAKDEAATLSPRMLPDFVAGFELPDNRRYHPGHTWALQESPTLVRVGIDDFGARLAGKLDSLVLPKRGQWLRQGQKFAPLSVTASAPTWFLRSKGKSRMLTTPLLPMPRWPMRTPMERVGSYR